MAIKYSFVDGELYGTEDINDIARNLVGAGVMPFLAKDSYNVSDLNLLTEALVESGTSLEGCKCTAQNAGAENMYISVGQGIVFFESGVRLTVDEAGYVVEAVPNIHGYIFAHYSPSLQKADIVFAADLPTDGESVVLAEVLADGGLGDKRTFARSKIATIGKNVMLNQSFEKVVPELLEINDVGHYIYILAKTPVVDLSKFNYALVYSPASERYEMLNLNNNDSMVYLQEMYTYGPRNYARVINNRLCVTQNTNGNGTKPYQPEMSLSPYKVILV